MFEMNWEAVIELAIFVLAALISMYVIPWLKTKLGEAQYNALWERVCMLVQAAQKLFPKIDEIKTGAKKNAYVKERLTEDYGVTVTPAVEAMIEAAVEELT